MEQEERQVRYVPKSAAPAIGTLVPANLHTTTQFALDKLVAKVGNVDNYVCKKLQYTQKELFRCFAAEQIDAIAIALTNVEQGKSAIVGDMTGVGKGRVAAALIRFCHLIGRIAVFVTADTQLYPDMQRDLNDINTPDVKILPTNSGLDIAGFKTQGAAAHKSLLLNVSSDPENFEFDAVFTTYSQLQSVRGDRTHRHEFFTRIAPHSIFLCDESHRGAGSGVERQSKPKDKEKEGTTQASRAAFLRELIAMSQGALFLSATFAKTPSVMTLYSRSDMPLAVGGDIDRLVHLVHEGGVPLQQSLCSMLSSAGQYVRRERSWEGIDFEVDIREPNRELAQVVSEVMGDIMRFDRMKEAGVAQFENRLARTAKSRRQDGSIGETGVSSITFTSIMHNLINQFLLALKADAAVEKAVQIIESGAKPLITVSNTMGAAIARYVEERGLRPGDEIDVDFGDLLLHYLERSREALVKDSEGKITRHRLTDKDLGKRAGKCYEEIKGKIERLDFKAIPLSPIDYIRNQLQERGIICDEITGRTNIIDYTGAVPAYRLRYTSKRKNVEIVKAFNSGTVDALVLNRSGSTGISLHSSHLFADQRPRWLIVAQQEGNIDDAIQILGRISRTGQVHPPKYSLLMNNLPGEKRPAAVLMKKLASLNANTTASRQGTGAALKGLPDFLNPIGDIVCTEIMMANPNIHEALGRPLNGLEDKEETGKAVTEAARKVTGRIPLLSSLELQEKLYGLIETQYQEMVNHLDAIGDSALEARFHDFQAQIVSEKEILPADGESPFCGAVNQLTLSCKSQRKPYTTIQTIERVEELLGLPQQDTWFQDARIAVIERKGAQAALALEKQMGKEANRYKKLLIDKGSEESLTRFNNRRSRLEELLKLLIPGKTVEVSTPVGSIWGVIGEIEWLTNRSSSPVALSSWQVRLVVANTLREITIPLSKINNDKIPSAVQITPEKTTFDGTSIWDVFDFKQVNNREQKTVLTGNLLRAFDRFGGRIINFSLEDGSIRPGLLVSNDLNVKKILASQPVLLTPETALAFVAGNLGVAESPDRHLRVFAGRVKDNFTVEVEKSKLKGGKYYLDPTLIEAIGQFHSSGSVMRAHVRRDALPTALQAILSKTQLRVFDNEQKKAARLLSDTPIPAIVEDALCPVSTCEA